MEGIKVETGGLSRVERQNGIGAVCETRTDAVNAANALK
jgi:hypothetical protein